ncbi:MAG: tetratricopeptide repeat protein [Bacteroidales bacterium]|jgi:tetratricopeptide (TPR) repeat protein|nr:tetratricopeptide repeat protein [Bacteroidales bacterium]
MTDSYDKQNMEESNNSANGDMVTDILGKIITKAAKEKTEQSPNDAIAWQKLGYNYYQSGDYEESKNCYLKSVEIDNNIENSWAELIKTCYLLGEYDEGLDIFRKVRDSYSSNSTIWEFGGKIYHFGFDDFDNAHKCYEKVVELKDNDDIWVNLGYLYQYHYESYNKAFDCYKNSILINPDNKYAWNNIGYLYDSRANDKETAKECYLRSIEIDSEFTDALNNLGVLYHIEKNGKMSMECFEKVLNVDPDNYIAYKNLGITHGIYLDDNIKAEEYIRKSLEINPDFLDAWYALGMIYKNIYNKPEEADIYFKRARI